MRKLRILPKLHIELERWRYYLPLNIYVSNLGNIRNAAGLPQKVCCDDGYIYYKGKRVHRIVMEAWKPKPGFANLTVDHLNHNTRDNRVSNLEWVTGSENIRRATEDIKVNTAPPTPENNEVYVTLNGVKLPAPSAKEIILGCNSLPKAKIEKIFKDIQNLQGSITYGGYTIRKCT